MLGRNHVQALTVQTIIDRYFCLTYTGNENKHIRPYALWQ